MKSMKKIASLLLALVMALALMIPAVAAEGDAGSITLNNATIGETYHLYKLFDVTYGAAETDGTIPTDYFATEEQKNALEAIEGNVFAFAYQAEDDNYQVTVGTHDVDGVATKYTDEEVIAFIDSFIRTLSGGVTACAFPGAKEVTGTDNTGIDSNQVATASTIQWKEVPYGYYFVTSSLGAVVSLNTSNPNAEITDKNPDTPDWNNEPDEPTPDGPVKDVLNEAGTNSIKDQQVRVGDVLTYSISYTNKPEKGGEASVLDSLTITDAAPVGTTYKIDSATATRTDTAGTAAEIVVNDPNIEWTFTNVGVNETVEVRFQVTVTDDALTTRIIENDANTTVKIGDNTYEMKTNQVKNPVEDPDDPVKDVMLGDATASIDGEKVEVGNTLTYKISYTNHEITDLNSVTITDAAPTGTVYVDKSATGTRQAGGSDAAEEANVAAVASDGTITWTFNNVAANETVTAYFKVNVTEAAKSITNKTIVNDADVSLDGAPAIKTNQVTNTVPGDPDEPDDPNPGKVIINADGSESTTSTGSFGDTVKFDVGVNAVNLVKDDGESPVQVKAYYIYDQLDPGFDLQPVTMKVTIAGTEYTVAKDAAQSVTDVTTYTIGDGVGTLFTKVTDNGETLIEATIPWVNVETTGEGENTETTVTALYPNCKLHLTYDATINENAVIAENGNVNKVRYDYSTVADTDPKEPDPNEPKYPNDGDLNHGSDEKKTTTYTYALGLQKYSAETGEPLEGAEFTAVDAGGNVIHAVAVAGTSGVYNYTSNTDANSTFTTNADGQIIIKGVDIGSYSFTETKAPKGYNLLDGPVSVEATMSSSSTTHTHTGWTVTRSFAAITEEEFAAYTGSVYTKTGEGEFELTAKPDSWVEGLYKLVDISTADAETGTTHTVTFPVSVTVLQVENHAGSLLPSTGGSGTTIFYVAGSILLVGAAILLITKKRMNSGK